MMSLASPWKRPLALEKAPGLVTVLPVAKDWRALPNNEFPNSALLLFLCVCDFQALHVRMFK